VAESLDPPPSFLSGNSFPRSTQHLRSEKSASRKRASIEATSDPAPRAKEAGDRPLLGTPLTLRGWTIIYERGKQSPSRLTAADRHQLCRVAISRTKAGAGTGLGFGGAPNTERR